MSEYYRDTAHLFEIYGYFLSNVLQDPKIGPKMAKSNIIIKFIYTDPDCEITIDFRNPIEKEGYYGNFYLGPTAVKEDVWSKQSADHSHRFWHGFENPIAAVTRGKVRQGGKITAMLKLLPVVKHTFKRFPEVLKEMGYEDLIVKKRGFLNPRRAQTDNGPVPTASKKWFQKKHPLKNYDRLYIDGQWVAPAATAAVDVINPCNGKKIATVAMGDATDVARAVKAARAAFEPWAATPVSTRVKILTKIADALTERQNEIGDIIALEMGMPSPWSRMIQAGLPIATFSSFARILEAYRFSYAMGGTRIIEAPLGVCGFITPWNYPLHQIVGKVAPALAAGCTMVLKPSRLAPLNAFVLAEVLHDASVPPGVFNLVCGAGITVGQALCAHPEVDMVSVTGSTQSGIQVARTGAETVKRITQELGGKSANLILDDADFETAVNKGVSDCFLNSGQTCSALTRMLVPAAKQTDVIRIAKAAAESLVMGDAFAEGVFLGPMINAAQQDRVRGYIRKGVEEGATLVTGGNETVKELAAGFYIKPTIFADVTPQMTIAREEIFGPVLSIMPYADETQAIEMANDSAYGLSGAVWSADLDRARRVAGRLRTGQVFINGAGFDIDAPFGGYKQSGNGRERSRYGLAEFLEIKAVMGYTP